LYCTYLWQEQKRHPFYRIQTNDPAVARKLRRRSTAVLSALGLNRQIWQFVLSYKSPKIAKISFRRIVDRRFEKDAENDVLVGYTGSILTSKETS